MKKLLLAAALVLFSWGANAQETMVKVTGPVTSGAVKGLKSVKLADRISADAQARTATRAAAKAPAGTAADYLVYDDEAVYGFIEDNSQLLFPRMRQMSLIFGDGGKVYIPNFFLTSLLGSETYVEGTLDASGNIVIEPGQPIGTVSQGGYTYNFSLYKVDATTGQMSNDPITLMLDPEPKTYVLPENEFIGAFMEQGGQTQLYTFMMNLQLTDKAELTSMVSSEKYDYTYDEMTDAEYLGQKSTVDAWVGEDGYMVSTSLMPVYEDAMFNLVKTEGASIAFPSGLVVSDDIVGYAIQFADGGMYTANSATFTYNAATGAYELPADYAVGGLFYMADETGTDQLYINCYYSNASLKLVGGGTGISAVETADKGAAVATEYYDLSGRRVSAAAQGVSIKVEKYADGTSKAVKVVK